MKPATVTMLCFALLYAQVQPARCEASPPPEQDGTAVVLFMVGCVVAGTVAVIYVCTRQRWNEGTHVIVLQRGPSPKGPWENVVTNEVSSALYTNRLALWMDYVAEYPGAFYRLEDRGRVK